MQAQCWPRAGCGRGVRRLLVVSRTDHGAFNLVRRYIRAIYMVRYVQPACASEKGSGDVLARWKSAIAGCPYQLRSCGDDDAPSEVQIYFTHAPMPGDQILYGAIDLESIHDLTFPYQGSPCIQRMIWELDNCATVGSTNSKKSNFKMAAANVEEISCKVRIETQDMRHTASMVVRITLRSCRCLGTCTVAIGTLSSFMLVLKVKTVGLRVSSSCGLTCIIQIACCMPSLPGPAASTYP